MMHSFISLFAKHKVAPNLLMLMLFISGFYGLKQLNTQFFPDFAIDVVGVNVVWPGASAEDVQKSITIPLETELKNVANVKKISSSTSRGGVAIAIEVESGADLNETTNSIKQRVDGVRNLPADSETPTVQQFVNYENVGTILITADGDVSELTNLARQAERELLALGVSKIDVSGLPEREIAIQMNPSTVQDLGLSLNRIASLINNQSQDVMAGTAGRTDGSKQLRSVGKLDDVSSFEQLPLLTGDNAQLLRLGDVADISLRSKEDQGTISYDGNPAIQLTIKRSKSDDTLKTATIMNDWADEARQKLPEGVDVIVVDERWLLLKARISLLINNGAYGLLFVVGLLFIFLNSRVAFWVAMGIPASLLATWGVMYFTGGSINMISLFGMIMALGIIVDDAIVVGEDTLAHAQQGEPPLQAALGGAQRMMGPITASSLTTIAAFLPLLLIDGIIGSILADIPIVVICVILVSLVECFLILPGHLHHALKNQANKKPSRMRAGFDRGFDSFKNKVFRPAVSFAIDFRLVTFSLAITALVLAVGLLVGGRIQFAFFPSVDGDNIRANVQFSSGTPASEVADFLVIVEDALYETEAELGGNLISERISYFGTNKLPTAGIASTEQVALLEVELDSSVMRTITNAQFIETWNNKIPNVAGLEKLIIDQPQSGPPGKPIEANITGASATVMKQAALDLQTSLNVFSGVQNITDNLPYGMEQLLFTLTPQATTLGLTSSEIGRQLQYAFDGITVQSFFLGSDEIDVRLMLKDQDRNNLATLYALPIILPSGDSVPLLELVEFSSRRGIDKFSSENGRLTVSVQADVDVGTTNANVVIAALNEEVIPDLERQYGVKIGFGGARADEQDTLGDMLTGLVLALILIYIVLAWVFTSYAWPIAVMFTIPFGLTGAVLGHLVMDRDLTILSLFGLFGLSGIVINNSIVLLSFYKGFREQGMEPKAAIIEAACQRLRAVLLTSMTTIAGLTPILFEESLQAQFLIPMAISIVFGLALGTLLILFVVPSMVLMLENAGALVTGKKRST